MKQSNPSRGKDHSGGSIILTASGRLSLLFLSVIKTNLIDFRTVAGIRSGAGSTDCKFSLSTSIDVTLTLLKTVRAKLRELLNDKAFDSRLTSQLNSVNSIAQTAVYQLQKTDIRVNTICPGLIDTAMTALLFEPARAKGAEGKIGQLNPLGRYGLPQGPSVPGVSCSGQPLTVAFALRDCECRTVPSVGRIELRQRAGLGCGWWSVEFAPSGSR